MKDEEIDKIAQAIAAKLAEPGGSGLLGCGSASSTQNYDCSGNYNCRPYECGGAGSFRCHNFDCRNYFYCDPSGFACTDVLFQCSGLFREE